MGVCGSKKKKRQRFTIEDDQQMDADLKDAENPRELKRAMSDLRQKKRKDKDNVGEDENTYQNVRNDPTGSMGQIQTVMNQIKDKRSKLGDAIAANEQLLVDLRNKRKEALEKLETVNGKLDKMCLLRTEYEKTQDACKGAYNRITDTQEELLNSLKAQVNENDDEIRALSSRG